MPSQDDLISRLEAATGPSRELDAEIAKAIGWKGSYYYQESPRYTETIEAALTLVPDPRNWWAGYHKGQARAACQDSGEMGFWHDGEQAATPAIALVIACLKAKETPK